MEPSTYVVDLRSDTVTRPTASMRRAMSEAVVGDDVYGEDPTVNTLERRAAMLLGKQAALFVASGTMANTVALLVHCEKRGSECLAGDESHIVRSEMGGIVALSGIVVSTLKNNPDGTFNLDDLKTHVAERDANWPKTTTVAVENTHSRLGGKVVPMEWLDKLAEVAKEHSLVLHMDGARILNAAVHFGVEPAHIARNFDSVSMCFSKGLAAPVGSVIAGSFSFIRQARRARKALGGGMRQAGVLAAAALVSLDELAPALVGDHRRARRLAEGALALRSPLLVPAALDPHGVHTNMLALELSAEALAAGVDAHALAARLLEPDAECRAPDGGHVVVKAKALGARRLRLTTHYEIGDEHVACALAKLAKALAALEPRKRGLFG